MGYIQFHPVGVPQGNVVSLGLLNEQLQRQRAILPDTDLSNEISQVNSSSTGYYNAAQTNNSNNSVAVKNYNDYNDYNYRENYNYNDNSQYACRTDNTSIVQKNELTTTQLWDFLMTADNLSLRSAGEDSQSLAAEEPPAALGSSCAEPSSLDEEICSGFSFKLPGSSSLVSPVNFDDISSTDSGDSVQILDISLEDQNYSSNITPSSFASNSATHENYHRIVCHPPTTESTTIYKCPYCPSSFKVRGYLTRHLKKHMPNKAFRCPYWSEDCRCHPSGEFSRKDTFRTHLKSIHFVYPVGTTKAQRANSAGRCAACYEHFNSNKDWLKYHIDADNCKDFKIKLEAHKSNL
ncbi:C2H2-type zinc finger protein Ecym_1475 [Eremothecium cymbalariae DBVPG|uniref:C2H2-type domain-containing protein n=1 Tax=Eremothecium cymbalariae (strain CBS 270.75 / DBVPG 7215 / KCTC 17166 / NRRL Y-17582) TaxID=931890 RepID=G8JMI4_ERECY|nr:hypothetical protein Ecym_1475 [Eremothecium cymbalariae DBVPG\